MTYTNGTMTLPKNAVVMDREEMRYVGGGYWINLSTSTVEWIVNIGVAFIGAGIVFSSGLRALVSKFGKSTVVSWAKSLMKKVGLTTAKASAIAGCIGAVLDMSIGRGVAYLLDRYDKSGQNGRVQF